MKKLTHLLTLLLVLCLTCFILAGCISNSDDDDTDKDKNADTSENDKGKNDDKNNENSDDDSEDTDDDNNSENTDTDTDSAATTLVSYTVSESDALIGLEVTGSEYAPWSMEKRNSHKDPSASAQARATFNGKSFTGKYLGTNVVVPNLYSKHRYMGDNCRFEIDSRTGEICSFAIFAGLTTEFNIDENECKASADAFAKNYITLLNYEVEITPMTVGEKYRFYSVDYYKKIGGCKTNDGMSITVNGNGEIVCFDLNTLGAFGITEKLTIDKTAADKIVANNLKEMLKNYDEENWSNEINDVTLIKTESGNQALLYKINVEVRIPVDGEIDTYDIMGGIVEILVEAQ